ncbi:MAG: hypothetical protein NZZ41_07845 [Candidatus Dojkabacteria bacterium]|nr:hypothetical protein [Candidatus Dojkabacteria bacterium]
MNITIKPLYYRHINSFYHISEWLIRPQENFTLYFQLWNENENQRFVASSVTVQIKFLSENFELLVKPATQVSPLDASIFSVNIASSDIIFSGTVYYTINLSGQTINGYLLNGIAVEDSNQKISSC